VIWTPTEWAGVVLDMMIATGAEAVVAERNRGGDLVASNVRLVAELRAKKLGTVQAVKVVEVFATKGKASRLEEVETMGEQGRVHLPEEGLPAYEDQAASWDPSLGGDSPNVLDAAGWGAFYLFDGWGDAPPDPRDAYRGLGRPEPARRPPTLAGLVVSGDRGMM
jgi:phage terminase large subunit-like protein